MTRGLEENFVVDNDTLETLTELSYQWRVENETHGESTSSSYINHIEGPVMLFIGFLGSILNMLCLAILSHNKELKLSPEYLSLLRAQSVFDLLYILTSTPVTVLPSHTFRHMHQALFILPWIFPLMHVAMTASIYNTVILAIERYLGISKVSVTPAFPCKLAITVIILFSFAYNSPRFFELQVVTLEKRSVRRVNDTGELLQDFAIHTAFGHSVQPVPEFYTFSYFLWYNMIGSFVISLFVPIILLSTFNTLIWCRLKEIWSNRAHLGVHERRNSRAALSLMLSVIMFLICHFMKLVISFYQLANTLFASDIDLEWPPWIELCTFVSHFLLALNASLNLLIFCSCDKRFFAVATSVIQAWIPRIMCQNGAKMQHEQA